MKHFKNILRLIRKYGPKAFVIYKIAKEFVKFADEVLFYICRTSIMNIGMKENRAGSFMCKRKNPPFWAMQ